MLPILVMSLCVFFLAVLLAVILLWMVRRKKIADRMLALNMAGTVVLVLTAVLSAYLGHDYILDVAIVLALLNFLTVIVLCRLYGRRRTKDPG